MNRVYSPASSFVLVCLAATSVLANDVEESRRAFLKRFDANGDGKVTKGEARAVLEKEARQRKKANK